MRCCEQGLTPASGALVTFVVAADRCVPPR